MTIAVSSIINKALSIADMVNSSQITAFDANTFFNAAYRTVYDFLCENNDDYFVTTLSFTMTSNTYSLPVDFMQLRALDWQNQSGEWQEVKKFTMSQRNKFGNMNSGTTLVPMYRIKGAQLYLIPEGITAATMRMWYYPTPAQFSSTVSAWVTSTAYYVDDLVMQAGNCYQCIVAHTSGTFATDLSANKWTLLYTAPSTAITYPNNLIEDVLTHTIAIKMCMKTHRQEQAAIVSAALGDPASKTNGYWGQFASAARRDDANYETIRSVYGERRVWP